MREIVRKLAVILTACLVGVGASIFYVAYFGGVNAASTVSTPPSDESSTSFLGPNSVPTYDCPKPAVNSELLCDILPAGYTIAPHLPNAPAPFCLTNMSAAACSMLKQTQSNGICDPNETPTTSPLDCGCTGALVPDPFQGRCAAPATVCQLQLQIDAAKSNNGG